MSFLNFYDFAFTQCEIWEIFCHTDFTWNWLLIFFEISALVDCNCNWFHVISKIQTNYLSTLWILNMFYSGGKLVLFTILQNFKCHRFEESLRTNSKTRWVICREKFQNVSFHIWKVYDWVYVKKLPSIIKIHKKNLFLLFSCRDS